MTKQRLGQDPINGEDLSAIDDNDDYEYPRMISPLNLRKLQLVAYRKGTTVEHIVQEAIELYLRTMNSAASSHKNTVGVK